jgi:membrane protease YdiL (CAAX protease family)
MQRLLFGERRPLALDIIALVISPAICEELLFRGAVLRATRLQLGAASAIAVNGVLFGLFHLSAYRFLPTALLGVALAQLALRSGSIFPPMLFHFLNNLATVLVGRLLTGASGESSIRPDPLVTGIAVLVFASGMLLAGSRRQGEEDQPG